MMSMVYPNRGISVRMMKIYYIRCVKPELDEKCATNITDPVCKGYKAYDTAVGSSNSPKNVRQVPQIQNVRTIRRTITLPNKARLDAVLCIQIPLDPEMCGLY